MWEYGSGQGLRRPAGDYGSVVCEGGVSSVRFLFVDCLSAAGRRVFFDL